jgi:hypothetical protein
MGTGFVRMRRGLVGVLLALLVTAGAVAAGAVNTTNAHTRGVVLFVGDSNMTLGATAIDWTLTWEQHHNNGYVPVLASRVGAAIRTPDCLDPTSCTHFNYWKLKLATILPKVNADAIVNGLGINDTASVGTATSPGYGHYGQKIDWFMNLVAGKPVLWTNLPCAIEPSGRLTGCKTVNAALSRARGRWRNLTVLAWNVVANDHPEYMASPGTNVHYSTAGEAAWSNLVVSALDARFPAP